MLLKLHLPVSIIFVTMLLFVLTKGLVFNLAFAQNMMSAELAVSRYYPASGLLPVTHEYVRYDVTIKNTGEIPIANQSLWALFVSKGDVTHSSGVFLVPSLEPGESKILHIGPFKMRESGENSLFLGVNKEANSSLPNEVMLNYYPDKPADSFIVYEPAILQVIPFAVTSLLIGIGILVSLFVYKKRKKTN